MIAFPKVEMKPLVMISMVAMSVILFSVRQTKLRNLQAGIQNSLEKIISRRTSPLDVPKKSRRAGSAPSTPRRSTISDSEAEEIRLSFRKCIEMGNLPSQLKKGAAREDAIDQCLEILARLDSKAAARLLDECSKDPVLSSPLHMTFIHHTICEANANVGMSIALEKPDPADRRIWIITAFRHLVRQDRNLAEAWLTRESEQQVSEPTRERLFQILALQLARVDPDRALALVRSHPAIQNSQHPEPWAETLAMPSEGLRTVSEHLEFLSALDRAEQKFTGNPVLQEIRLMYSNQIQRDRNQWSPGDFSLLIGSL